MSPRSLRFPVFALAVGLLLVPMMARAEQTEVPKLTRISGESPFSKGCNFPFEDGAGGRESVHAEAEISLTVDPSNPKNMVAAWMQDAYAGIVSAATSDGGRTWTDPSVVPGLSRCSGGGYPGVADPWLSTGPDGTVYLASFSLLRESTAVHINTFDFNDDDWTWSSPSAAVIPGAVTAHDKPAVTADPFKPCVAYVVWAEGTTLFGPAWASILFSRTDDCGRNWSLLPAPVAVMGPSGDLGAPEVLVLPPGPDGGSTLLTIWYVDPLLHDDNSPHWIQVSRSTDGGATWSEPITAAEYVPGQQATDPEPPGENIKTQYEIPSADVTHDGTVHIAYHHQSQTREGDEKEIRVVTSTDGGQEWGGPTVVTHNRSAQPFLPSLAVAGNGTVGITYYDLRNDELGDEGLTTDVYLAHSRDHGRTWSERHLAGPFDLRTSMFREQPSNGLWVGEYHGIDGLPHGFAAAFGLAKPEAVEGANDVFFAQVHVPASPAGHANGVDMGSDDGG